MRFLAVFGDTVWKACKWKVNFKRFFSTNGNYFECKKSINKGFCFPVCRKKRMSTGMLNFYPMDDDDDDLFSKKSEPLQETIQKTEQVRQETAPSVRLQQRLSLKNRTVCAGMNHTPQVLKSNCVLYLIWIYSSLKGAYFKEISSKIFQQHRILII